MDTPLVAERIDNENDLTEVWAADIYLRFDPTTFPPSAQSSQRFLLPPSILSLPLFPSFPPSIGTVRVVYGAVASTSVTP